MSEEAKVINRICLDCGNNWLQGNNCPKCGSNRYVEREINALSS